MGFGGRGRNWCYVAILVLASIGVLYLFSDVGSYSLLPGLRCPQSFLTKESPQFAKTGNGSADLLAFPFPLVLLKKIYCWEPHHFGNRLKIFRNLHKICTNC